MKIVNFLVSAVLLLAVVAVYVDDSATAGRRPVAARREARRAVRVERRACHGSPASASPKVSVSVTTGN